ncbi:MAG: hypothetical protein JWR30_3836 [Conexibacter sp.]|nr:hypothetical protein [Conexibacter sp.]
MHRCLVSVAGAATATVANGPNVTGTATSSTLLKLHNSGKTLSCTGSTATGTVAASSSGSVPPGFRIGTLTPAFTGCNIVGGLGITVKCQPAALNVNALTASGSTKGSISSVSCHIFVTSQTACRITVTGSIGATHANSPSLTTTDTNHQSLASGSSTNGAGSACAVLPNDASARLVNASSGDLQYNNSPTNLTINATAGGGWTVSPDPAHATAAGVVVDFTNNTGSTVTITSVTRPSNVTHSLIGAGPTPVTNGSTLPLTITLNSGTSAGTVTISSATGAEASVTLN